MGEWLSLRGSYPRDHWFESSSRYRDGPRWHQRFICARARDRASPSRPIRSPKRLRGSPSGDGSGPTNRREEFDPLAPHRTAGPQWARAPYMALGSARHADSGPLHTDHDGPEALSSLIRSSRRVRLSGDPPQDEPASEGASMTRWKRWERYPDPAQPLKEKRPCIPELC
jgi:hypothetical protein